MRKIEKKKIRKEFAPGMPSATIAWLDLFDCETLDLRIVDWIYQRTWGVLKREQDKDGNVWALVSEDKPIKIQKIIDGLYPDENEVRYLQTRTLRVMGIGNVDSVNRKIEEFCARLDKENIETFKKRLDKLANAQAIKVEYLENETVRIKLNYKLFHPRYYNKEPLAIFKES